MCKIVLCILSLLLIAPIVQAQETDALTAIVRGKVRDQYGNNVDRGIIRSNGICATGVTRGEYLCSEIYGYWTYRFSASGYSSKSFSVNVDSMSERKDIRVICDDRDYDGVCDIHDNCREVPNGPREGTCLMKNGCSLIITTCDMDYCGCDCLLNQEIDPCLEEYCN